MSKDRLEQMVDAYFVPEELRKTPVWDTYVHKIMGVPKDTLYGPSPMQNPTNIAANMTQMKAMGSLLAYGRKVGKINSIAAVIQEPRPRPRRSIYFLDTNPEEAARSVPDKLLAYAVQQAYGMYYWSHKAVSGSTSGSFFTDFTTEGLVDVQAPPPSPENIFDERWLLWARGNYTNMLWLTHYTRRLFVRYAAVFKRHHAYAQRFDATPAPTPDAYPQQTEEITAVPADEGFPIFPLVTDNAAVWNRNRNQVGNHRSHIQAKPRMKWTGTAKPEWYQAYPKLPMRRRYDNTTTRKGYRLQNGSVVHAKKTIYESPRPTYVEA